jgi:hypothetical protein
LHCDPALRSPLRRAKKRALRKERVAKHIAYSAVAAAKAGTTKDKSLFYIFREYSTNIESVKEKIKIFAIFLSSDLVGGLKPTLPAL